jgi:HK97 family phage prohead protease
MNVEIRDTVELDSLELRSEDGRHYIEGIAVPWGTRTDRTPIPEVFERGAFDDLVTSGAKVKLTDYNHAEKRIPVAYSTVIENRDAGLWMRFRLNNTPEGRSAHENSIEGVYGGLSVGFIARAEEMRGGVRHVLSARLDHVSLVEEPAYREAKILQVRAADADEIARLRALIGNAPTPIDTMRRTSQNVLESIVSRRANR